MFAKNNVKITEKRSVIWKNDRKAIFFENNLD